MLEGVVVLRKPEIDDYGAKLLAAEVLKKAVKDIRSEANKPYKGAERDIRSGRCDLFMDILNIDMGHEAFIREARSRNDNKTMAIKSKKAGKPLSVTRDSKTAGVR